jgi:hypothetical protein
LNFALIISAAVIGAYKDFSHEILIVGSLALSTLWLMWLDHTNAIYKLAAYSEIVIARRLRRRHGGVLGWEKFLRDLDEGGTRASQTLYSGTLRRVLRVPKTLSITLYIRILFGGGSVAFIILYSTVFGPSIHTSILTFSRLSLPSVLDGVHALLFAAALCLLVYAGWAERQHRRLIAVISEAIARRTP